MNHIIHTNESLPARTATAGHRWIATAGCARDRDNCRHPTLGGCLGTRVARTAHRTNGVAVRADDSLALDLIGAVVTMMLVSYALWLVYSTLVLAFGIGGIQPW